jgi:hypothetical protein
LNAPLTTKDVMARSNKPVHWICEVASDHVWAAPPQDRTKAQGGCPFCTGKRVALSTCLATKRPDLAAQLHPTKNEEVTAYTLTPGSKKSVWWTCSVAGHPDWLTSPANRSRSTSALCPSCTPHGFSMGQPGRLYLIHHAVLGLLQIGISNEIKRRLREHARGGWQVLAITNCDLPGDEVYAIEQLLLEYLRRTAEMAGSRFGRFSGFTEAWVASSLPVTSLDELFELAGCSTHVDGPLVLAGAQ